MKRWRNLARTSESSCSRSNRLNKYLDYILDPESNLVFGEAPIRVIPLGERIQEPWMPDQDRHDTQEPAPTFHGHGSTVVNEWVKPVLESNHEFNKAPVISNALSLSF